MRLRYSLEGDRPSQTTHYIMFFLKKKISNKKF